MGLTRDHQRWRRLETRPSSWEKGGVLHRLKETTFQSETIETLTLSGSACVVENGVPQESGMDDPLEVFGDHAVENVALQRPFLKESVLVEPVVSRVNPDAAGTRLVLEHKLPPVEDRMERVNFGFCHAEVHLL